MDEKQIAIDRDKSGECIVCGKKEPGRRRGLCVTHYNRFRAAFKRTPSNRRKEYDQLLVSKGQLLPSHQGQRIDPDEDVFSETLTELLGIEPAVDEALRSNKKLSKRKKRP